MDFDVAVCISICITAVIALSIAIYYILGDH